MARPLAIAVLDVGKSNVKLALVDRATLGVRAMRSMPNTVRRDGPYPHFDVDRIFAWALDGLAAFAREAEIVAISTTCHGGGFAIVAGDRLALPLIDYEYDGPDAISDAYGKARGGFDELLSPDLRGNGLNAGRQFYWLARAFPEAFARAEAILPYPQYWAWRLTGRKVAEATSFGAHTDLWNGRAGRYSRLAENEGWVRLFPEMVKAWDTVGTLLPDIARQTGIGPDCRVVAGIHDSNASLLPHILKRPLPFAVISTGTWIITCAPGGSLDRLDPERGGLAYIDAFVRPVPAEMSMGGREFEMLTAGATAMPTDADIAAVIEKEIMALPAIVQGNGPFGKRRGGWTVDPETLSPGMRVAAASLYCALLAETCLGLAGARGPVFVEGPFARNRLFLAALAALVRRPVIARPDATGTTEGAALLAFGPDEAPDLTPDPPPAERLAIDLAAYAARWREQANA